MFGIAITNMITSTRPVPMYQACTLVDTFFTYMTAGLMCNCKSHFDKWSYAIVTDMADDRAQMKNAWMLIK